MGRGITMDEWVHFERLHEEGRVPNSSYWYVHCCHCVRGYEQKQLFNPPAKLTGRRSAMKAHLKICPMYATQYKMEQRALAAAAAAAAATSAVAAVDVVGDGAMADSAGTDGHDAASAQGDHAATAVAAATTTANKATSLVGTVTIKTQSGEKRKRRGEDVEASGPRGGRGKHCMMEEWEHFIRLQDEGYIAKSNFFFAVCRHCQAAYDEATEDKKALLVPEKMVGRREKMRKHLSVCPFFEGDLPSLERRTPTRVAGGFLPMPLGDGIKMVPASALASSASAMAMDAAGLSQAGPLDPLDGGGGASSSSSTARLALDEWQFFTRLHRKKDSAYYYARCNFCQHALEHAPETLKASMAPAVVMGRKSNMQTHLARCPYVPKDAVLSTQRAPGGLRDHHHEFAFNKRLLGNNNSGSSSSSSLHQILIEILLQHRLPFEWVDSSSAKKLLQLAAAGVNWHESMLPNSVELRNHALDDLVRDELHGDVDKLKQSVALPPSVSGGEDTTVETTRMPVTMKLSFGKPKLETETPSMECVVQANGVSVPLQYVVLDKDEPMDDETAATGGGTGAVAADVSHLSYYHGLELARVLIAQVQRVESDQQLTTGVLVLPPNAVTSRAVGLLRARMPQISIVWNLDDVVAFALRKTLQNPEIAQIITVTTDLLRTVEYQEAFLSTGVAPSDVGDWISFPSLVQELVSDRMSGLHELLDSTVDRTSLLRVSALLRAFVVVETSLAVDNGGRVSLVDTLTHLATLYSAAQVFGDIQHALEVGWHACEQPLYLLAHALHPHLRLRGMASATELTKLSVLSDLSVAYFTQFFNNRKPLSLRGDVTSFLHKSQPVFADSFVGEFPLVEDYYRYLRDNFAELAAFMELLQSFSVESGAVATALGHTSTAAMRTTTARLVKGCSEQEQKKLALLKERWAIEPVVAGSEEDQQEEEEQEDVEMTESGAEQQPSVVDKWLRKLAAKLSKRMVDFSLWDAEFESTYATPKTTTTTTATEGGNAAVAVELPLSLLPSQPEDDVVLYPSAEIKDMRAKKVRLAQLFSGNESTTV